MAQVETTKNQKEQENLPEAPLTTLSPGSHTWREFGTWRYQLMLLQAFMLQTAHPAINAGVHQHSTYKTDPWGRIRRSINMLWPTVYSPREKALETSVTLRNHHRHIKGTDKDGNKYTALDPEAYGWVHFTGYDLMIRLLDMAGEPPTPVQRQEIFEEWRHWGLLLGLREKDLPATPQEYWKRFNHMIDSRLEIGEVVEDLLDDRFYLEAPKPPALQHLPDWIWRQALKPLSKHLQLITVGTLPVKAQEKFGINLSQKERRKVRRILSLVNFTHRQLPKKWRYIPLARRALIDSQLHPEAYHPAA